MDKKIELFPLQPDETEGVDALLRSIARDVRENIEPDLGQALHTDSLLSAYSDLTTLVEEGHASEDILVAWEGHVQDNRRRRRVACVGDACSEIEGARCDDHERLDEVARFLARNPVRVVPSLGGLLRAALFTGPQVNTIVVPQGIETNSLEMAFLVMECVCHRSLQHVDVGTYDFHLELRRDVRVPDRFVTPELGTIVAEARRAACCLWDDAYRSPLTMRRTLLRSALRLNDVSPRLLRTAAERKSSLRIRILRQLMDNALVQGLRHRIHRPALYRGPVAAVQARGDMNVYLLHYSHDKKTGEVLPYRRWIPSDVVLGELGLCRDDVAPWSWDEVQRIPEAPLLIDPGEVRRLREILSETTEFKILRTPGVPSARLRGMLELEPDATDDLPPPPPRGDDARRLAPIEVPVTTESLPD